MTDDGVSAVRSPRHAFDALPSRLRAVARPSQLRPTRGRAVFAGTSFLRSRCSCGRAPLAVTPYPLSKHVPYRILVTDGVDPEGVALLTSEPDFDVEEVPTLPKNELLARIDAYDALVGRSATKVSEEVLRKATRLKVLGRAGVGVDNIALETATELGVAVINAPAGNTVAVAELFFGVMISLIRQIPRADASLHAGRWERSDLMGTELKGKTLGIVGVGRIGSEIA